MITTAFRNYLQTWRRNNTSSQIRTDGPPISAIRSFPQRPAAARQYGSSRRSGQSPTSTDTWLKFLLNPALTMVARASRGGGDRGSFTTGQ